MTYNLPNPWGDVSAAPETNEWTQEPFVFEPVQVPLQGKPSPYGGLVLGALGQELDAQTFMAELMCDPSYWWPR